MAVISVASTIDLDDNYLILEKKMFFKIAVVSPGDENRAKIDDFIAIFGPINRAIYHDKIGQFDEI
jgi:hypothetical protein